MELLLQSELFPLPALPGAPPVREKPVKANAAPKSAAVFRAMTAEESVAVECLKKQVNFPPAQWDKRFVRELRDSELTEKQAAQVWRLFHRYRRQITHPRKDLLLEMARHLAAPDSRSRL